jgi:hypothetical protein
MHRSRSWELDQTVVQGDERGQAHLPDPEMVGVEFLYPRQGAWHDLTCTAPAAESWTRQFVKGNERGQAHLPDPEVVGVDAQFRSKPSPKHVHLVLS